MYRAFLGCDFYFPFMGSSSSVVLDLPLKFEASDPAIHDDARPGCSAILQHIALFDVLLVEPFQNYDRASSSWDSVLSFKFVVLVILLVWRDGERRLQPKAMKLSRRTNQELICILCLSQGFSCIWVGSTILLISIYTYKS
jgi:hypothetical protein